MPLAIPLLLAMGIDELSMSAGAVPYAKEQVRSTCLSDLRHLWDAVKGLGTASEIKALLQETGVRAAQ